MRYLGEGSEGSFWLRRERRVLVDPHIHLGLGTASKHFLSQLYCKLTNHCADPQRFSRRLTITRTSTTLLST
jgi:hypothetical protein